MPRIKVEGIGAEDQSRLFPYSEEFICGSCGCRFALVPPGDPELPADPWARGWLTDAGSLNEDVQVAITPCPNCDNLVAAQDRAVAVWARPPGVPWPSGAVVADPPRVGPAPAPPRGRRQRQMFPPVVAPTEAPPAEDGRLGAVPDAAPFVQPPATHDTTLVPNEAFVEGEDPIHDRKEPEARPRALPPAMIGDRYVPMEERNPKRHRDDGVRIRH